MLELPYKVSRYDLDQRHKDWLAVVYNAAQAKKFYSPNLKITLNKQELNDIYAL